MIKTLAALAALSALAFAAPSQAAIVISAGSGSNFGGFNNNNVGDAFGATTSAWGPVAFLTNGSTVEDTSVGGQYAQPDGDSTKYLYATTQSDAFVGWQTGVTSIDIYWGSVDDYNGLTLSNNDSVNIADVIALLGYHGSGWVKISDATPFNSFLATSSQAAFEFDIAGAPEPATWAMMLLGFAGLGYAGFSARRKTAAAIG